MQRAGRRPVVVQLVTYLSQILIASLVSKVAEVDNSQVHHHGVAGGG